MTNIINGAYNGLLKVIKFLIAVMAIILVVVVFTNVVSRYFLHSALAWAEETARFLFIWLTFMGAILANASNEHMQLDLVTARVPKKVGQVMLIIANIVILVILGVIIKGGTTVAIENYEWMTPALEISYGLVYSIAPIGATIMALQTLARIFGITKSLLGLSQDK